MWQFTPLRDYIADEETVPEPEKMVFRQIWVHYWKRLFARNQSVESGEVEFVSPELQSAPVRLLNWVAPPPKWGEMCGPKPEDATEEATVESAGEEEQEDVAPPSGEVVSQQLSSALEKWQDSRTTKPGIQMVLAAPHSGVDQMVRGWAERQGYLVVSPPSREAIFTPDVPWLDGIKEKLASSPEEEHKRRLVIVGLERSYLRHHDGLTMLRALVDYLVTDAPPSLVVCQSWAWSYLRSALHLDAMVLPPFVLARASGAMLAGWLIELSSGSHHRAFTFRQGREVLFTIGGDDSGGAHEDAYSDFCARLAKLSRGNPGIARAIWRQSISIEADVDIHEQVQWEAQDDPGYTIWVQPLDKLIMPVVPATYTNEDAFILQTLLIHNGLPLSLLQSVLPLSASRISRRLQVMLNAGLVQQVVGQQAGQLTNGYPADVAAVAAEAGEMHSQITFEVSPLGYGAVRAFLRESGFFIDDL